MSDPRFFQKGFEKQLAHVVGECGEVLAAAGKTQQWGLDGVNPLLPKEKQETNGAWLIRELADLKGAIARLEETLYREHNVVSEQSEPACYCGPDAAENAKFCPTHGDGGL